MQCNALKYKIQPELTILNNLTSIFIEIIELNFRLVNTFSTVIYFKLIYVYSVMRDIILAAVYYNAAYGRPLFSQQWTEQ